MSARAWSTLIGLLLALSGVFVVVLFFVQNSLRTTQLSLDLYVGAWQLDQPVPVVYLIGGSFAVGLLLGFALWGVRSIRLGSRVRRLEAEAALAGAGDRGNEWR